MKTPTGSGSLSIASLASTRFDRRIFNREEFINWWNSCSSLRLGDEGSPLWVAERECGVTPTQFVVIEHRVVADDHLDEFWAWCGENLKGDAVCYSSSAVEEWWGLTDEADTLLFLLKWA